VQFGFDDGLDAHNGGGDAEVLQGSGDGLQAGVDGLPGGGCLYEEAHGQVAVGSGTDGGMGGGKPVVQVVVEVVRSIAAAELDVDAPCLGHDRLQFSVGAVGGPARSPGRAP